MTSLPLPNAEQLTHSSQLACLIQDEIAANGGWISFARYMELALYAPGLGYYSAGMAKFGDAGDFITAPEISPLFGRALARQVAEVLHETAGSVLELGAGTGRLAVQLLQELERIGVLPERYLILDVSAHLRSVQRETFARELPSALQSRIEWLESLPLAFSGCIVANEVLDALPVHLVRRRQDGWCERGVAIVDEGLVWRERCLTGSLAEWVRTLPELPEGYLTELCLAAPALIASLAASMERGGLLLIDYGFPRREYYHPHRSSGTLMCHYRHYAHDDPLLYPGLQDITAHVDFTSIAEAALAHGLQVAGYASQAQFLINCGITELLAEAAPGDAAYYALTAQVQKLLSPAEMGELFKVVALGKSLSHPLLGFVRGDKRHTL